MICQLNHFNSQCDADVWIGIKQHICVGNDDIIGNVVICEQLNIQWIWSELFQLEKQQRPCSTLQTSESILENLIRRKLLNPCTVLPY